MPKIENIAQDLAPSAPRDAASSATGDVALNEPQRHTQRITQRVFGPMIAAGVASYSRARDLPKLLTLPPEEIEDDGASATERIVMKLAARTRAQALLGRRRHWSYDLNRHLALLTALKAERAHLAHLRNVAELAQLITTVARPVKPRAA